MNTFRAFIYLFISIGFLALSCGDDETSSSAKSISETKTADDNKSDDQSSVPEESDNEDKTETKTKYTLKGKSFDLKDCRAQNYGANAKTELELRGQIWCGDI